MTTLTIKDRTDRSAKPSVDANLFPDRCGRLAKLAAPLLFVAGCNVNPPEPPTGPADPSGPYIREDTRTPRPPARREWRILPGFVFAAVLAVVVVIVGCTLNDADLARGTKPTPKSVFDAPPTSPPVAPPVKAAATQATAAQKSAQATRDAVASNSPSALRWATDTVGAMTDLMDKLSLASAVADSRDALVAKLYERLDAREKTIFDREKALEGAEKLRSTQVKSIQDKLDAANSEGAKAHQRRLSYLYVAGVVCIIGGIYLFIREGKSTGLSLAAGGAAACVLAQASLTYQRDLADIGFVMLLAGFGAALYFGVKFVKDKLDAERAKSKQLEDGSRSVIQTLEQQRIAGTLVFSDPVKKALDVGTTSQFKALVADETAVAPRPTAQ